MRRDHEKAAELLSAIESKATAAAESLTGMFEDHEAAFALLDDDERDEFGKACNALHDLVRAAESLAHQRRMAASRTSWTAQDWASYDLVRQNID